MNIWNFQTLLNRRLTGINIVNLLFGVFLSQREDDFWRGVGAQAIGWALINLGIAFFGSMFTRRRKAKLDNPDDTNIQRKEKRNLRNILLVNCFLNPLYIYGGARFAKHRIHSAFGRGTGWGIMLQGAILACFDTFHVRKLMKGD